MSNNFICEMCGKSFDTKFNYKRHINRKTPCKRVDIDLDDKKCNFCGITFNHKQSLYRHLKKCTLANAHTIKDNYFEQNVQNNSTNNIIDNRKFIQNIQNNISGNVKLVKFGDEDLSSIKDDVYKKILNSGFKSVPNLIEHVHFNTSNPDNQNIYISNMKNTFILVYDGEKWEVKDRDDVIEELMYSKTDHLLEKFDDLIDELPTKAINKFQRFIEKKDDDKVVEQMKKDIKLILYNNRHLPIDIRKKLEKSSLDKQGELEDGDIDETENNDLNEELVSTDNDIKDIVNILESLEVDKIKNIKNMLESLK